MNDKACMMEVYIFVQHNLLKMSEMSFFNSRTSIVFFLLLLFSLSGFAQNNAIPDYKAYVNTYKDIAVREMKLYKIPASITLAQGIIESNCGLSPLATDANNHFGIKCHKDWTGEKYYYDDDEKQECFRKYKNAEESFRDHSLFLVNRPRYSALFSLDSNDYTGWAMGLKQAGYATNPQYPSILIRIIEVNKLYLYDSQKYEGGEELYVEKNASETPVASEITINEDQLFRKGYVMPVPADFQLMKTASSGRKVYDNNGIPIIFAQKGDTWYSLAKEFNVYAAQLQKDNEMTDQQPITIGQIIYLEPKKRKCTQREHIFKENETLFSISIHYGVKLKYLLKYNNLQENPVIAPGTIIRLHPAELHLF